MKQIIPIAACILASFTTVHAQDIQDRKPAQDMDMHPRMNHKAMMPALKELDLSAEQKTKLKAINEEQKTQMEALRKEDNITVKEQREKMESLQKDFKAKRDAVLTDEQKKKLETLKAQGPKEGKGFKKGGRPGPPPIEELKEKLNLTDKQVEELKKNRETIQSKFEALRSDNSLTPDQKKEKVKVLMEEQKAATDKILSKEQQAKLKDFRKENKGEWKQMKGKGRRAGGNEPPPQPVQ